MADLICIYINKTTNKSAKDEDKIKEVKRKIWKYKKGDRTLNFLKLKTIMPNLF